MLDLNNARNVAITSHKNQKNIKRSISSKSIISGLDNQYFEIDADFPPQTSTGIIDKMFEKGDIVTIQLPSYYNYTTSATTTATQGATTLTVSNATGFKIGVFFRFSSHNKLYMVKGISGSVLTINCPLLFSVTSATLITTSIQVDCIVENEFEISIDTNKQPTLSYTFSEYL